MLGWNFEEVMREHDSDMMIIVDARSEPIRDLPPKNPREVSVL